MNQQARSHFFLAGAAGTDGLGKALVGSSGASCPVGVTTGRQDTSELRVERRHQLLKQKPP